MTDSDSELDEAGLDNADQTVDTSTDVIAVAATQTETTVSETLPAGDQPVAEASPASRKSEPSAQDNENLSAEQKPVKPWRLPFWTDDPIHRSTVLDAEPKESDSADPQALVTGQESPQQQAPQAAATAHPKASPKSASLYQANSEQALISDTPSSADCPSNDLADDSVSLQYPTVDELEKIRRDAYTDGLEQGLIEGRQKGQKEGHDEGYQTGFQKGQEAGLKQGQEQGFRDGQDKGYRSGQQNTEAECQRLHHLVQQLLGSIQQRDQELPNVLTQLLVMISEQVLQHELQCGARSIQSFIEQSLERLPSGESCHQIRISREDHHLIQQLTQKMTSVVAPDWIQKCQVDESLAAGQCQIIAEHSLVEYSLSDAMQQQLLHIAEACLSASQDFPHQQESEMTDLDDAQTDPQDQAELESESESEKESEIEAGEEDSPVATSEIESKTKEQPPSEDQSPEAQQGIVETETTGQHADVSSPDHGTEQSLSKAAQTTEAAVPNATTDADVDSSEVESSEVESSEVESSEVESSEVESSEVESSEVESSEVDSPEVDSLAVDSPEVESPEVDSFAVDSSEVAPPQVIDSDQAGITEDQADSDDSANAENTDDAIPPTAHADTQEPPNESE